MAQNETQFPTDVHFEIDEVGISSDYHAQHSTYEALREEIVFILQERIKENSIKIHSMESRVKELKSLIDKCIRKSNNDPFSDFVDIAAARIVCLFSSDIEKLKTIVSENFDIVEIDDKIEKGNDPLSYLSVHMICKMKSGFSGPRYEKILGKTFEIQIRTLCMHCWAAVSHHMDYKGDWDVPANLKMALSALSGLFYVADSQFEQFNVAMASSKKSAQEMPRAESKSKDINLDTVTVLLRRIFPERKVSHADKISEIVQEIKSSGYLSLDQLQKDLEEGIKYVKEYEDKNKGSKIFFIDVGAARHALSGVSKSFAKVQQKKNEIRNSSLIQKKSTSKET